MPNKALQLYESTRPLESLESFIFRTAQRLSRGEPRTLVLREVSNESGSLEFLYDVEKKTSFQPEELGAVGGFAVASALTLRACITRKSSHVLGAVQAVALAFAFGGRELPRLSRRFQDTGKVERATICLKGSQLCFEVGGEEVWADLAPVVGLTLRTFRFRWKDGPSDLCFAQVEMQDGRLLTLSETSESNAARRLLHQLAKPIPVELTFQNVDLYREDEKVSWELGPRLVEPALN